MRNLLEGWCAPGLSLADAGRRASVPSAPWWETDWFRSWSVDEQRASVHLWLLTGREPRRRDEHGAGDGRADLLLVDVAGGVEVAEVLSTREQAYTRDEVQATRLVHELNPEHEAQLTVAVRLADRWAVPRTRGRRNRRPWEVASALMRQDVVNGLLREETLAAMAAAWPSAEFTVLTEGGWGPGVFLSSWGARAVNSDGVPYLVRLSSYLESDVRAIGHVEKLRRETDELGAARTHLYLIMVATGVYGNLLPSTPSWMTDGDFRSPEGLTDIWLDGDAGYIMHWTAEDGWRYHDKA